MGGSQKDVKISQNKLHEIKLQSMLVTASRLSTDLCSRTTLFFHSHRAPLILNQNQGRSCFPRVPAPSISITTAIQPTSTPPPHSTQLDLRELNSASRWFRTIYRSPTSALGWRYFHCCKSHYATQTCLQSRPSLDFSNCPEVSAARSKKHPN